MNDYNYQKQLDEAWEQQIFFEEKRIKCGCKICLNEESEDPCQDVLDLW